MSAFIVSRKHIDALIQAGLTSGHGGNVLRWRNAPDPEWTGDYTAYATAIQTATMELRHDTADRVGAMLWNENHRSVDHRYQESTDREVYVFPIASTRNRPAVEILKALACYEYQTCEHPEWKGSEAQAFCDALRMQMIHQLPGYDKAPWEIR